MKKFLPILTALAFFLVPFSAFASISTPTMIAHYENFNTAAPVTTSTDAPAGSLIVVFLSAWFGGNTITSVTDSAGNAYAIATHLDATNPFTVIAYALNTPHDLPSGGTITATWTGGNAIVMSAYDVTGANGGLNAASVAAQDSTNPSLSTGSLASANELVFGGLSTSQSINFSSGPNSAGFTELYNTTVSPPGSVDNAAAFAYDIVTSTASVTYAPLANQPPTQGIAIAAFEGTPSTTCDFGSPIGTGLCRGYLTTTGSNTWTVPADWNSSSNTIEVLGAGGSGGAANNGSSAGGGGGGYSKQTNVTLTPSGSVTYFVGAAGASVNAVGSGIVTSGNSGGDTWLCNSTTSCSTIGGGAVQVGAKGGSGGDATFGSISGGTGGASASGVGTLKESGGNGGSGPLSNCATGGGGAGGASGNGTAGGTCASSNIPTAGGSADAGSGGVGGTAAEFTNGGNGFPGAEWDAGHGSGAGGGAGDTYASQTYNTGQGGTGGSYGGGGGAGHGEGGAPSSGTTPSGAGQQGLIVITYAPTGGGGGGSPAQATGAKIQLWTGLIHLMGGSFRFY